MDEAMAKSGDWPNVAVMAGTDPAEVMREHGRADNGAEVDTREKLEADAENLLFEFGHYCVTSREGLTDDVYVFIGDFTDLLDRQVAITERECMKQATTRYIGWDCAECAEGLGKELDARCDPLKERIAELEEERDLWLERYTQAHRYANEITDERDALKKQINRFDVPKSEEIAENGTSKGVLNNFDVQNDTREQLEADIAMYYVIGIPSVDHVLEWLDRQAAISERELCGRCSPYATAKDYLDTIAKLTAERDQLREELRIEREAVEACEGCDKVDELTAERDQLSRDLDAEHALVVQFEHDNERLRDTCNTLRASVAGLKMTVERFKARESGDARRSG